eukprot:gene42409-52592_t
MLRVRRMGSCPCKQPGRSIARFHSNPAGKCLAGRSAALRRLWIAGLSTALRAVHPIPARTLCDPEKILNRMPMAKILEVKYENQADAHICEVAHESQADLCWHEVHYATQASGDAIWFFVAYANQASFKVYRVKHASQADLKIFRVSSPEQAGWRTKDHLLIGKLGK